MLTIARDTFRAADVGIINLDEICIKLKGLYKQDTDLNSNALLLWTGLVSAGGVSFGADL